MRRLVFFAVALAACSGHDPMNPGEPLGAFRVTGKLVSTSCGTVPDPWEFDVKLRHSGSTLYWVQGTAPEQGLVDASAHTTITATDTRTLREADERQKLAACIVTRTDKLDMTLTDGTTKVQELAATKTLNGTLTYRFTPASDSMCEDQLLSAGGDYEALPCEVTYTITATRTGSLPK